MNLPGYDAWKLASPPDEGPTCDACGDGDDVRLYAGKPICHACYLDEVDGWSALPTPEDHARDLADERADALYDQRKDDALGVHAWRTDSDL